VTNALGITATDISTATAAEIDEAVRMLISKRRALPQWITDGRVAREDVVDVVRRALQRVAKNTGGYKAEHEGTYGYEVHALAASGYLWFPDEDLVQVSPAPSGGAIHAATITPAPGWAGW
jgi:hypothetical protein